MTKHEGPKDASEIRVCYTPKEYVEAGREIMKEKQQKEGKMTDEDILETIHESFLVVFVQCLNLNHEF